MPRLEIRQFGSGDGPAVRELHERPMRDAGDFVEGAPEPDLQDVPGHYLTSDGEFLVGTADGKIVAMVAYHPASEWFLADRFTVDDRTAELTRMRVAPDHQRRGYGSALYEELEGRARASGDDQFVLDVSEGNDAARAFYERLGFEYVETVTLDAMARTVPLATYRTALQE